MGFMSNSKDLDELIGAALTGDLQALSLLERYAPQVADKIKRAIAGNIRR